MKRSEMIYLPNERGQGLVEYGLILALVAIVIIVALALLCGLSRLCILLGAYRCTALT